MKFLIKIFLFLSLIGTNGFAEITAKEKAQQIHLRVAGVGATPEVLAQMEQLVKEGRDIEAAQIATENPNFINITVKQMGKTLLDMDETDNIRIPLNDFVATIAGFVRDDIPFNQILSADIVYTLNGQNTAPALNNNDHYQRAEDANVDLVSALVQESQSALNPQLDPENAAGLFTTRGFASVYIEAGTNRAAGFHFPAAHLFCKGLEGVMGDGTYGNLIKVDVDRFPSGDHNLFLNECQKCHQTNDAVTNAFNYYDWDAGDDDGALVFLPNAPTNVGRINNLRHPDNPNVAGKVDKFNFDDGNVQFPMGHKPASATVIENGQEVPFGDTWYNAWATNTTTKVFGFYGPSRGRGPKSYGQTLTMNKQFPVCMVTHAFKKTCYHKPTSSKEKAFVESLAFDFANKYNYNMKRVFQEAGVYCSEN